MIKSRRLRWAEHILHMGEITNTYIHMFIRKHEREDNAWETQARVRRNYNGSYRNRMSGYEVDSSASVTGARDRLLCNSNETMKLHVQQQPGNSVTNEGSKIISWFPSYTQARFKTSLCGGRTSNLDTAAVTWPCFLLARPHTCSPTPSADPGL
jgi:hypothetical protein